MFIAKSQVLHVVIAMHCNALWPFLREKMDTSFTNMRQLNDKYFCQKRAAMHHLTMKTLLVVGDRLPEQGDECICTYMYPQTMSWQQNSEIQVEFLLQQLDHISRSVERQAS